MSTLTANIKLFNPINNRLLGLQALVQIIFPLMFIFGRDEIAKSLENNQYPALIFFCFLSTYLLGTLVAVIQVDLLTKPFSACMPNQDKTQVNILFLAGITASLFYCTIFLLLPHPAGFKGMLYFISIISIGLSVFLIGAFLTFYVQKKREKGQAVLIFNIMFCPAVVLLSSFDIFTLPLDYFLYYASAPLLILVISLIATLRKKMENPDFKRMLALKDFTLPYLNNQVNTIQQADNIMLNRLSDRVKNETVLDGLFLRQIKKHPYFSIKRFITAEIYSMMDRYYALNERFFKTALFIKITILSLLLLITGYQLPFTGINDFAARGAHFIFVMLNHCILIPTFICMSTLVSSIFRPVNHTQLFPEGRSRRFRSSISIWLLKQTIIVGWVFLVILSAQVFQNIIPGFMLDGIDLQFSVPAFSIIFWPLVIVPVFDLFMYYFEKPCSTLTMVLFVAIMMALSLLSLFTFNPIHRFISMALALLLANGFFIERLARYWFKKDLELFN